MDRLNISIKKVQSIKAPTDSSGFSLCISAEAKKIRIRGDLSRSKMLEFWLRSLGEALPILAVISLLYGGVHATSWNGHFPSFIEQVFWRVASCTVAGAGVIIWATDTCYENNFWGTLGYKTMMGISTVAVLLFDAARLFLLTEAFISVRNLPIGAYSSVTWSQFLPHIYWIVLSAKNKNKNM